MRTNTPFAFLFIVLSTFIFVSVTRAQWTKIHGPDGGIIYSLASHQSDIYAGSRGVYVSHENQEWQLIGLENMFIRKIAVNNDGIFACSYQDVYFKSFQDTTWTRKMTTNSMFGFEQIACDNNKVLLIDNTNGPYLSDDNGNTWTNINPLHLWGFYSGTIHGNTIFVSSQSGLYKSEDNGLTWELVNIPGNGTAIALFMVNNTVFAQTNDYFFRSFNKGVSWEVITDYGDYFNAFTVFDSTIMVCSHAEGPIISHDFGSTWTSIAGAGLTSFSAESAVMTHSRIIIGTQTGNFITYNNGISWQPFDKQLRVQSISCIDAKENLLLIGTDCGSYLSYNKGNTWEAINLPEPFPEQIKYVGINKPYLYISTDNYLYVRKDSITVVDQYNQNFAAHTGSWFFASLYMGNIIRYSADGTGRIDFNCNLVQNDVNVIMMLASSGNTVYAGGSHMTIGPGQEEWEGLGIFRSPADHCNWMPINDGLTRYPFVNAFCQTQNKLFIATEYGDIYSSPVDPVRWQLLYSDNNCEFRDLICTGDSIIARGEYPDRGNIILSPDLGQTWQDFNEGLSGTDIHQMIYNNGRLYATNFGPDILTRAFGKEINYWQDDRKVIIYPNPGNGLFRIRYAVEFSQYPDANVYRINGKKCLHIPAAPPGTVIDLSSYPSGIYFVEFSSEKDGFREVRKICKL